MHVVFVSKSNFGCGNFHTIDRIRTGLTKVAPHLTTEHCDLQAARHLVSRNVDLDPNVVVVALNLSRCAFLTSIFPPLHNLVLICGGSDLNEDTKSAVQRQQMSELIDRSCAVVFFCSSLKSAFLTHWPNYHGLLRTIPQSVLANRDTALSHQTEAMDFVEQKIGLRLSRFVLFVGRLRPLKDPLFPLQPFLDWLSEESERGSEDSKLPSHHLLCIGSVEENATEIQEFFFCLKNTDRIHWLESLPQTWVFGLMTAADCLINSSRSEGQPLTLMEAMAVGCPILARNIPANLDLIENDRTGLIFRTQAELKVCLQRITHNSDLRARLAQNALQKIRSPEYQFASEATSYLRLLEEISSRALQHSS
uniref:Glycosyltransferase 1 domain-containing protein 1 n=2 Tax=Schistocephalus solidus TaxID=70667 RepID=A0A0V0J7K9_SCHSO